MFWQRDVKNSILAGKFSLADAKNLASLICLHKLIPMSQLKVAEHSFQVPMPNSPLLLNHLCFGAHFLQESRLTAEVFILAFLQGCVLLPWQWGWLKTRL